MPIVSIAMSFSTSIGYFLPLVCRESYLRGRRVTVKWSWEAEQLANLRADDSLRLLTVTIDTVTDLEDIAALRPDFERLGGVTGNRLPFALHDWQLTWCQHFLNQDSRIRDQPLFYVLRNSQRACVALLPFILSRRRLGPIKVGFINLLGGDPSITEIRAPLVEPGYESLTAAAVHGALEKIPDWDWVHWAHISPEFAKALSSDAQALSWQPSVPDFVIDLAPSWEEFRARLKRNVRESLRHSYNSLKREGITFEFEAIEQAAEIRRGLDRYLELHRMRAEFASAAHHPDRFANKVCRDFLVAVCERLAARRAVRLFALKVQGQVVAMRLAFVVADSLYLYYSGFDPRWWRFGVMTTTVAEAIKYAIANGFKTVNLSPINEVSKTRWGPRQVDYSSAYEPKPRLRSRLANSAYLKHRSARFLQRIIPLRSWN
ncbi:MAG TPA: GNAT family N-acetyltransferase [Steroidobacteraceae bacterium]|nr:GNAT family N-acetyltransferase [Steroidobacteraceae bacterium]